MAEEILHKCDFIQILKIGDDFYIESFKKGFSLSQFNEIMRKNSRIRITSFTTIKSAIDFAPKTKEKFGELKDKISIEISGDSMKAFIFLNAPEDELSILNRENFKRQILQKLSEAGVIYGIKDEILLEKLENEKKILIAEGVLPVNGENSIIKMYEVKEAKPELHADGSVDHYELNLINHVNEGDWLGERIDATPGIPGKNVKGEDIPPVSGKNNALEYDKNSVYEQKEDIKTVLYALINGAVNYSNGQISVSNHLEINGNVDFSTGNIDFDGCVTIKGTIDDNFTVIADGDIEILGDLGVGTVKSIESRKGDIYIKGGISSKSDRDTIVKAQKNVFAKYIANASVVAGGMVHIGYYCINSDITAREVVVDASKGQIMGGVVKAEARIVSNIIGSPSEKRTMLNIRGVNKFEIQRRIEKINETLTAKRTEQAQYKKDLGIATSNKENPIKIEKIKEKLTNTTKDIKELEKEKKTLGGYLKVRGDGEIIVQRKIYANCSIEIQGLCKEINEEKSNIIFYASEGELKETT